MRKRNRYLELYFRISIVAIMFVVAAIALWLVCLGGWTWLAQWFGKLVSGGR